MPSVTKYQTAAGQRWEVRYRTPERGTTRRRGFTTKRDAEAFLISVEHSKATGAYVPAAAGRVVLRDLHSAWSAEQTHLKATTVATREVTWTRHVEPRWGDVPVGKVTASGIRSWVAEMKSAGAGVATMENALSLLRMVLGYAVEGRYIVTNPSAGVKLPRREHRPRGYLTAEQVEELAAAAGDEGLVIRFLAYTGLRWGEMAALKVGDFDMLRRRVSITRAVAEVRGKVVESTPKSHEKRSVPFPSVLAEDLAARMAGRGRDSLVFTAPAGGTLRVSHFRPRVFNPAVKACQIATLRARKTEGDHPATPEFPDVSPHDLRHTAASLAISAGANVKGVQVMLGHASAAMTLDVYGDLFEDDLDLVAGHLDKRIRQAVSKVRPSEADTAK